MAAVNDRDAASPLLLDVRRLTKHYPIRAGILSNEVGRVRAVDDVSFAIDQGETLGLVGESGCGKSSVGKTVLKLIEPTSGEIRVRGTDVAPLSPRQMRPYRRDVQMIFQDPYASLNPRLSAGTIVAEPLVVHGVCGRGEIRERVAGLFERVGLRPEHAAKYPHEFSGGQRQRIGIARALALRPGLIIGDEPVSALDVSIQAQVINLLIDLQDELGLGYLFIAHDLSVVNHISHRVAVMYLGRIVELAPTTELFAHPLHPYTQALLSAVPVADPRVRRGKRVVLKGDVPSPANPPRGCRFHTRCPHVFDRCRAEAPELVQAAPSHSVACHLHSP